VAAVAGGGNPGWAAPPGAAAAMANMPMALQSNFFIKLPPNSKAKSCR
jgi:hypothetical protein